jgi:cell division protein FtsN
MPLNPEDQARWQSNMEKQRRECEDAAKKNAQQGNQQRAARWQRKADKIAKMTENGFDEYRTEGDSPWDWM